MCLLPKQDDRLGDMMLQYATLVKLYSSYAQNLDEAFDTLRTRPEFAVFIFDAEANVLCEGRPLAEIVRYSIGRLISVEYINSKTL